MDGYLYHKEQPQHFKDPARRCYAVIQTATNSLIRKKERLQPLLELNDAPFLAGRSSYMAMFKDDTNVLEQISVGIEESEKGRIITIFTAKNADKGRHRTTATKNLSRILKTQKNFVHKKDRQSEHPLQSSRVQTSQGDASLHLPGEIIVPQDWEKIKTLKQDGSEVKGTFSPQLNDAPFFAGRSSETDAHTDSWIQKGGSSTNILQNLQPSFTGNTPSMVRSIQQALGVVNKHYRPDDTYKQIIEGYTVLGHIVKGDLKKLQYRARQLSPLTMIFYPIDLISLLSSLRSL